MNLYILLPLASQGLGLIGTSHYAWFKEANLFSVSDAYVMLTFGDGVRMGARWPPNMAVKEKREKKIPRGSSQHSPAE